MARTKADIAVIRTLNTADDDFAARLAELRAYEQGVDEEISTTVEKILADVLRPTGNATWMTALFFGPNHYKIYNFSTTCSIVYTRT